MLALTRIFLPIKFFKGCALLAPVGLIPFLFEQRHLYDFPTLFLFTLALYYLAKNDLPKYILVFILVTLSKETSLFLVVFFAMQFRKMERRSFLAVVLIQIAIYVFIRGLLMDIYKNNPGRILEFHLYEHLNAYSQHPVYALILFSTIILIMSLGAFISMDKSNFVRNSLSAIGGPALLLYFFFGVPFEVRVFLETYPSIYLTVCLAIVFFIDRSPHVKQLTYAG
jgi:hypothetical protein